MAERLWRVSPSGRRSTIAEQTWQSSTPTVDAPWHVIAKFLYWTTMYTAIAAWRSPSPTVSSVAVGIGRLHTAHNGSTQDYQTGINPSGTNAAYFA